MTIIEVMASALLILLGLGAIFAMNTQSYQILRKTRQAATSSQILQERIEMLRTRPWPEVARGPALCQLLAKAAVSAPDLADSDPTETVMITVPPTPAVPQASPDWIKVQRRAGDVTLIQDGDLFDEPLLVVEAGITWREMGMTRERKVRTIIARSGLTRSGIFGSAFGRPAYGPLPSGGAVPASGATPAMTSPPAGRSRPPKVSIAAP